jgi:hypothetical protein
LKIDTASSSFALAFHHPRNVTERDGENPPTRQIIPSEAHDVADSLNLQRSYVEKHFEFSIPVVNDCVPHCHCASNSYHTRAEKRPFFYL